jgi:hypothetical protein
LGAIVILFVFSLVLPIVRYYLRRTERKRTEEMFYNVADLCIRMERIEDRQEEMLEILRDLQGDL